jgi:hypothetical protein
MSFRPTALLLAALAAPAALAQNQSFDIIYNGKSIGKDTYTLAKSKTGFKLTSHYAVATRGLATDIRDSLNFTPDYTYIDGTEENQDNNKQLTWLPSKDHKDMHLDSLFQGSTNSQLEPLAGPLPLILIPAFDAGAIQAAVLFIAAHASEPGYTAWAPGYLLSGLGARDGVSGDDTMAIKQTEQLPPNSHSVNMQWVAGPAMTGTLNGQPIKLKSYQLGFDVHRWTIFTDESNTLMEVDVTALPATYVRAKFKLDKPAK